MRHLLSYTKMRLSTVYMHIFIFIVLLQEDKFNIHSSILGIQVYATYI